MTEQINVLVTGGAGYIGSHAVLGLREAGFKVVVVDDLSAGRREAVPADVPLIVGEVGDATFIESTIVQFGIGAVMHFAGSIVVPESVADPLKYYENNTAASRTLIATCLAGGVDAFIFSSTAAVYGEPEVTPVREDAPKNPSSPYGTSKLMVEWMLRDTAVASGLHYAALRYFNVAGADPQGRTGQSSPGATHLLKRACQTAVGTQGWIDIFGDDYDTPDGTCLRDYIHVTDLVDAHVLALRHLLAGGDNLVLNCGYGRGYSVRDVLEAVERETGSELTKRTGPRRPGDIAKLVAANDEIRRVLDWQPRYDDLALIVRTALAWERRLTEEHNSPATAIGA